MTKNKEKEREMERRMEGEKSWVGGARSEPDLSPRAEREAKKDELFFFFFFCFCYAEKRREEEKRLFSSREAHRSD